MPTNFSAALFEASDAREANEALTLLGRLGTPGGHGGRCGLPGQRDDASYVTAETLVVSGGMQSRL